MSTPIPSGPPQRSASLAEYFRVVEPQCESALFSNASRTKLQFLTTKLPPLSKSILECRLTENADQVDLSVSIPRAPLPLPDALSSDPIWREFQAICAEWLDPTSTIHRLVKEIWIELDGAGPMPPHVPSPNLFFALNWDAGAREHLHEIARSLMRRPVPEALARSLLQVKNDVLHEVPLAHLGAMLARASDSLRLVVSRAPGAKIADYIDKIGWVDRDALVRRTLERLQLLVDEFYFDFDLRDGVGPRVFVECFVKQPARRKERWAVFFDYLATQGLCSRAKGKAALDWMGVNRKPAAGTGGIWPASLCWGDELLGALATSVFIRDISHVKLAFEAGKLLEAKVYLSFEHGWFDRRKLLEMYQRYTATDSGTDQEKKNV